ncbi:hypothetical protein K438DRAFT_1855475 [Mycena galopus ATCC 62051]|nr:hypothetical protein K438DRAFT_1855475 [Mycena galopus ATCC 62051]
MRTLECLLSLSIQRVILAIVITEIVPLVARMNMTAGLPRRILSSVRIEKRNMTRYRPDTFSGNTRGMQLRSAELNRRWWLKIRSVEAVL